MSRIDKPAWVDRLPDRGHWVYHLVAPLPGVDPEWNAGHVYIGMTSNLRRRLTDHSRKWWFCTIDRGLCEFIECADRAEALRVDPPERLCPG